MSRILTPVGWREINEEVELEEDVLTEEELEFATEEIVNALNVLIDYDIIDESALNELSPSTLSSYAKKASGERRKWTKHIIPIRQSLAKMKSDGDEKRHGNFAPVARYWEKDHASNMRTRNQGLPRAAKKLAKRLPG
jgi:hypothetical protein